VSRRAIPPHLDRRSLLRSALGGAVGASLPLAGCGDAADTAALTVTPLAEDLILVSGAGGNVVAARGPDGVVMVDGGRAEHTETLGRAIASELGSRDVAALFNTHWHPDQVGSNARLGRRGVPIVAHENTRLWLTQEIERPWEDFVHAPLPEEARPNRTFYAKEEMAVGDETVAYGYMLQAHTDGDIYVHFRNANVIVAGGVVSGEGWPEVDWWTGGWIGAGAVTLNANLVPTAGGMVGGLATLITLADAETRIVPAHGGVLTRGDLEAQLAMYGAIAGQLRDMLFDGLSPEDVLAARPAAAYEAEMGDPNRFLTLAFQSLWGHYAPDA
jgi:glyoxylase-like metal-dependent hydrolase (beta-lactamase superfamily II)